MNKQIILMLMVSMFLFSFASGLETMKPAKLNQEYTIIQTCSSCSYVNISVSNINGIVDSNIAMLNNGSGTWYYDYTPTSIGRHDVTGVADLSGTATSFATYFEVTSSGLTGTLGFYFLILILSVGIIILGIAIDDLWVVILGGFALILVGLFTLFNGIDGMKDVTYTWGLGIITLMLGAYFTLRASIETMGSD